jgi:hypothetical protein
MGDKIHSKVIARKAKVSMIPGYDGEVKDEDECIRASNDIGSDTTFKRHIECITNVLDSFRLSCHDKSIGRRRRQRNARGME